MVGDYLGQYLPGPVSVAGLAALKLVMKYPAIWFSSLFTNYQFERILHPIELKSRAVPQKL